MYSKYVSTDAVVIKPSAVNSPVLLWQIPEWMFPGIVLQLIQRLGITDWCSVWKRETAYCFSQTGYTYRAAFLKVY